MILENQIIMFFVEVDIFIFCKGDTQEVFYIPPHRLCI